jgi:hypothetical protein
MTNKENSTGSNESKHDLSHAGIKNRLIGKQSNGGT